MAIFQSKLDEPVDWARGIISTAIVALFAWAYANNVDDDMMKGALIAAFSSAVAYWLGSSKGSNEKSRVINEEMRETSQLPKSVTVDNPPSDPVNTTDMSPAKPKGTGVPDKPIWE